MSRRQPSSHTSAARSDNSTHPERRQRRSGDPAVALGLLLDAVRDRQGYSALAIADASGLLVAGSGHFTTCEELAAHAPLTAVNGQNAREVQALDIGGVSVLVAGLAPKKPGLAAALEGCSRILGCKQPPGLHA